MNLLKILSSKPHNAHYLNRYVKFIEWCAQNQSTLDDYTEKHHICPKAKDLFPEYSCFKSNPWNEIKLSARQHIVAHILLWKTFNGSQRSALHYILNIQNELTEYNNRKVPKSIDVRYAAKLKEEFNQWRKGKATFKDAENNHYFLEVNDPKIEELNLVGFQAGLIMTEESKQLMRDAKFPNKMVEVFFLDNKKSVKLFSEDFDNHIAQGWTTEYTKEDREYTASFRYAKSSNFWANRNRYATSDGVYHGSYLKDDSIIKELDLILYRTEKQVQQNAARVGLATAAKLGTNLYTNGVDEIFANEPPDESWHLGRKPRSDEWETKRRAASAAKLKGAKMYTNGIVCMPIQTGDTIPEGFYPGLKMRPETIYSYTNKSKSVLLQFKGQHEIPKDLTRIKVTAVIDTIKLKLNILVK